MQLQITHDRIYFTNLRNEQVVIGHPPEYADAIAGLIQFCRAYRTPDERALDAVLEAAFDSGEVEQEVLVALVKAWTVGEAVKVGELRSHDGIVYKATKEHTTAAIKGTLDETGFWVAYKAKMKEE
jgi:hypothetical protein